MPASAPRVLVALAAVLALFVSLAVGQELEALEWLDRPALDWFEPLREPRVNRWVAAVTRFGDGWVLTAVVLAGAAGLWQRHRQAGAYLLVTGAGSAVVGPLLKALFARARPEEALRLAEAGSHAFPSGHSFGSAVVYGAVAVVAWAGWPRLRRPAVTACSLLVFAVGLSRLHLRVHYPSDVLAGWSLGVAWSVTLSRWLLAGWGTMPLPVSGQERERA